MIKDFSGVNPKIIFVCGVKSLIEGVVKRRPHHKEQQAQRPHGVGYGECLLLAFIFAIMRCSLFLCIISSNSLDTRFSFEEC